MYRIKFQPCEDGYLACLEEVASADLAVPSFEVARLMMLEALDEFIAFRSEPDQGAR